jgi:hypothetical protein
MGPAAALTCVCLGASGLCKLQRRCCSTHAWLLPCTLVPTNLVVLLHKQAPLQYKRCTAECVADRVFLSPLAIAGQAVVQRGQAHGLNRHQAGRHAERHARIAAGMNCWLF